MSRISSAQVEENIEALVERIDQESFIYDLLLAYGHPKSSVTLLRKGTSNKSKDPDAVILKNKLYYKPLNGKDLHAASEGLRRDEAVLKLSPRFIIVTDFNTLVAVDTKTQEGLDIPIVELHKHYGFFLPWAGIEKAQQATESIADRKAAEKMAKLYDEIRKENIFETKEDLHSLNVFLCRVLFCFFAEDTEIFAKKNQFSHAIESHTQPDGSDLAYHLERIFHVMALPEDSKERKHYPAFILAFPFVNGGLFKDDFKAPKFNAKSWKLFIESGKLNWSEINPDIFGSMMQAVVHTSKRGSLGMHYTSVPNIMKVIDPLFLSDLKEELEKARGVVRKLERLHKRILNMRIFDPACGSGNFLIIAYRELRKLEMEIYMEMQAVSLQKTLYLPQIQLTQFYGIEIDDFASEVAVLSLWLAEHQMNVKFKEVFGKTNPALPLGAGGKVVCDNATRLNWEEICPKEDYEIFILGNPPYVAYSERNKEQKADMEFIFEEVGNVKRLDYIGCWFKLASDYIQDSNATFSFVSTNSICQGEQVSLLWPYILFSRGLEIFFACQSFKWSNNAKGKAGVTCIVAGIQNKKNNEKSIYSENKKRIVKNISPYLIEGDPIIVYQRKTPISDLPEVALGSSAIDGGHLILSPTEANEFISTHPEAKRFIKPYIGGGDFIDGVERFCLWIDDDEAELARSYAKIADRIEQCEKFRLGAGRDARKAADVPHRFYYRKYKEKQAIVLPMTSSERRDYLPLGFCGRGVVVSHGAFVSYEAEPYVFGVLSSKMHIVWVKTIAGRLEERIRYSNSLCYNSFPFPKISEKQKEILSTHVFNVIAEREKHPEKSIASLYDSVKMPDGLKEAHQQLDLAVEQCYRSRPFTSDEERIKYLFKMYEKLTTEEQPSGSVNGTQNTMLTVMGPLSDTEDVLPLGE